MSAVQTYETMFYSEYHDWKYNENTWFILHSGGTQYNYLLEGADKALLIDTGLGQGNIRQYVERLTPKPVEVICTHTHFDHIGGNGWWDSCYLQKDYEESLRENLAQILEPEAKPHRDFTVNPVADGDVLDLGGRRVEVIGIPAHADTSIALLDHNTRLLFVGDEIECRQVLLFEGVIPKGQIRQRLRAHRENMQKLKARGGEFDWLCPAHNGAPMGKEIFDDYIELSTQMLNGTHRDRPTLQHAGFEAQNGDGHLSRAQHGYAAFLYTTGSLDA